MTSRVLSGGSLRAAVVAALLMLGATVTWGADASTTSTSATAPSGRDATTAAPGDVSPTTVTLPSKLEDWGVEIVGVRLSSGGYMLDFRYRVTDPVKAAPLFKHETKPYLLDQATGAKFAVPAPAKIGPLRTSGTPEKGRICFIMFANPGNYVKPGAKVSVIIGEFRAADIVAE